MSTDERHHDLDNLRALAMLAGVLFHAALAYSPMAHPIFPTADRQHAAIVDHLIWFVHLFRMPLFFTIAGYLTAKQIERRGFAGMMRQRALRIGLPLVILVPVMHLTLARLTLDAAVTVAHPAPLLAWLRDALAAGPLPPHPPGTGHLWFLAYLMLFLVLLWVVRALELGRVAARLATLRAAWYLALLPLALAVPLATVPAPHPAPESILPQFWAIGFYGAFFGFGLAMAHRPALLDGCGRAAPALLVGSLALQPVFMALLTTRTPEQAFAAASWPLAIVEAAISLWMTLACLGFGRRLLAVRHRVLEHLAETAYWTYLLHLPILFAVQYRLIDSDLHWTAKFGIAVTLTLATCLLSHRLLVRHTPLAAVFGGATVASTHRAPTRDRERQPRHSR